MLNKLKHRFSFYTLICCLPTIMLVGFVSFYSSRHVFQESLGIIPALGMKQMTFSYITQVLKSSEFIDNLLFSLKIALISSLISVILGVLFAFRTSGRQLPRIFTFWSLFILLSYVAASLMIYNTFADKGLLAKILYFSVGYRQSLNILFNPSGIGIILLYVFKGTPFVVLSTYNLFAKINAKHYHTSLNLGISPFQYFTRIVLPIARRPIFAIWIILFNFILMSYEGFFFLGTSNPKSIGEMSVILFNSPALDQRPMAMTISAFMIVVSFLLSFLYMYLVKGKGGENETFR